ncbi:MAG: recombinase family protein, partial [Deltaproteobacteria bacterium]|nr:recombinase family protein [Deltaproteobacteria bacterium]
MKAVILARVSTKEQEEQGQSLPSQVRKLREYAQHKGFDVEKEFVFAESAGPKIRLRFEEMLNYIRKRKGNVVLLCQNVDRLTRNFRDAVDIDELRLRGKLEVHFLADGFILSKESAGNVVFQWDMRVMLAKQYLSTLVENGNRTLRNKVENGEWIARAPLGYINSKDNDGRSTIERDKSRAMFIRRLFVEYSSGLYSLSEMQIKMNGWGMTNKTPKRSPVSKKQVHEIIRNPFYFGVMRVNGELYPHKYEPIIDKELFDTCEAIRLGRNRNSTNYSSKPFLFRGLIHCAYCGCAISSDIKKNKYIYLRCTKHKGECGAKRVREELLAEQIKKYFRKIKIPAEVLETIKDDLKTSIDAKKEYHEQAIDHLQSEYKQIQQKIDRALDVRLEGSITKEEYDRKVMSLKLDQQDLSSKLSQYTRADDEYHITVNLLLDLTSRLSELFESSKLDQKRRLLKLLFSNLKLDGEKLLFTVNKPFDLLMSMPSSAVWHPQGDSNPCRRRE